MYHKLFRSVVPRAKVTIVFSSARWLVYNYRQLRELLRNALIAIAGYVVFVICQKNLFMSVLDGLLFSAQIVVLDVQPMAQASPTQFREANRPAQRASSECCFVFVLDVWQCAGRRR